ncbi:S-adenosyl-L-methionine-dependent methyltransferase [Lipomyces oligophaga]|uniref:S-adenosyl-L-methionine-dependent methyltransferase n=1 Tax=Lipomyces oligophaga TaxID=45792 RepID=UPI0034CE79E7
MSDQSLCESNINRARQRARQQVRERAARCIASYDTIWNSIDRSAMIIDFACSSGALSHYIAPILEADSEDDEDEDESEMDGPQFIGIDINPHSVAEYNKRAQDQGLAAQEMYAICFDINSESLVPIQPADVIISSMAFHHLNLSESIRNLTAKLLKPQGWLALVDLQYSDETANLFSSVHRHKDECYHVHHHGGIKPGELLEAFASAGLVNVCVYEYAFQISVPVSSEAESSSESFRYSLVDIPYLFAAAQLPMSI